MFFKTFKIIVFTKHSLKIHCVWNQNRIFFISLAIVIPHSCVTRRGSWAGSSSTTCWWLPGCTSGQCVQFGMSGWRTCYLNSMRWTSMSWAMWQEKKWLTQRWYNGRPRKQPKDNQVLWIFRYYLWKCATVLWFVQSGARNNPIKAQGGLKGQNDMKIWSV